MAQMTPRIYSRGKTTGEYRHPDMVPAQFSLCMAGTPKTGEVRFSLTVARVEGEPRIDLELSAAECARIGTFSRDLVTEKPQQHAMSKRTYMVYGQHKVTVRGWYQGQQWYTDPDKDAVTCDTCSLSAVQDAGVRFMADHSLTTCEFQGCRIEWLV